MTGPCSLTAPPLYSFDVNDVSFMNTFQLGRLGFSIDGSDDILPPIEEEFSPIQTDAQTSTGLEFHFQKDFPVTPDYVSLPPVLVSPGCFQVNGRRLQYQVQLDQNPTRVYIRSNVDNRVTDRFPTIPRFRDWNYLTKAENQAKNFMYNIFDYLFQIESMKCGQTFVHASSLEKNGEGVMLAAWGGIGKTSSMLKLVTEGPWNYLSDDLALADIAGNIYFVPKKLQVYAYNVANQPILAKNLLKGRPFPDRLSWARHLKQRGPKGVRRRIAASELLGRSNVSKKAKLTKIIHLERWNRNEFHCEPIDLEALAHRSTHTLLDELNPLFEITTTLQAADQKTPFPSIDQVGKDLYKIMMSAFSRAENSCLKVPLHATPDDLHHALKKIL